MSFILDALRKSEHDRQRQSGPGLAEVPVAPRRQKTNPWATAAIALLIVNLVGIGVLLLGRTSPGTTGPVHPASPAGDAGSAPSATPTPPASTSPPTATPAPQASITQTLPQPMLRDVPPAVPPAGRNPLEAEVSGGPPEIDPETAARAASVPSGPPAVTRAPPYGTAQRGSVRYEPIPEAAVAGAIAAESRPAEARATPAPSQPAAPALPTADEMTATAGLPPLHLDLHVYSSRPSERFIFVNSRKYREGDAMQEGPTVEQITAAGAVLDYRGTRFLLTRD